MDSTHEQASLQAERIEELEAEAQQLQLELEDSNDRVCSLENSSEQYVGLESKLAEAQQALKEVD